MPYLREGNARPNEKQIQAKATFPTASEGSMFLLAMQWPCNHVASEHWDYAE